MSNETNPATPVWKFAWGGRDKDPFEAFRSQALPAFGSGTDLLDAFAPSLFSHLNQQVLSPASLVDALKTAFRDWQTQNPQAVSSGRMRDAEYYFQNFGDKLIRTLVGNEELKEEALEVFYTYAFQKLKESLPDKPTESED